MAQTVFITGAAGSGTTLLLRLLSAPDDCASIGENYLKPEGLSGNAIIATMNKAIAAMWEKLSTDEVRREARYEVRRSLRDIGRLPELKFAKRIFLARRAYGQFRPNLRDMLQLTDQPILVIYRDPRAASYSVVRQKLDDDIVSAAKICVENLTRISRQIEESPPGMVEVISYEQLCRDRALDLTRNERWSAELSKREARWLSGFFEQHASAWAGLSSRAEAGYRVFAK